MVTADVIWSYGQKSDSNRNVAVAVAVTDVQRSVNQNFRVRICIIWLTFSYLWGMGAMLPARQLRYTPEHIGQRMVLSNLLSNKRKLEQALESRHIKKRKLIDTLFERSWSFHRIDEDVLFILYHRCKIYLWINAQFASLYLDCIRTQKISIELLWLRISTTTTTLWSRKIYLLKKYYTISFTVFGLHHNPKNLNQVTVRNIHRNHNRDRNHASESGKILILYVAYYRR